MVTHETRPILTSKTALHHLSVLPLLHNPCVPSQLPSHPMHPTASLRPDTSQQFGGSLVQAAFERAFVGKPDTRAVHPHRPGSDAGPRQCSRFSRFFGSWLPGQFEVVAAFA